MSSHCGIALNSDRAGEDILRNFLGSSVMVHWLGAT